MSSPLESLDPAGFQQLAAALAIRALGANVQSFGPGPDGGRDFTFHGVLRWAHSGKAVDLWDGYTVFQVKKKADVSPAGTHNASWLAREITDELNEWTRPDTSRGTMPHYLVFVSNVPLTPVAGTGGFDTVTASVDEHLKKLRSSKDTERSYRAKRIRAWRIWDRNQICTLIDAFPDVRTSFKGLLTVPDVLAYLRQQSPTLSSEDLEEALQADASKRLLDDRFVYFEEAGSDPSDKTLLHDVVIDLPMSASDGSQTEVIRHIVQIGDLCLRADAPFLPERRHVVVTAGPGNGKSTVSRFLAQIYRVALLVDSTLGPQHQKVAEGVRSAMRRMDVPMPSNRRWPVRIDLAEYSARLTSGDESPMMRWIADKIDRASALGQVHPWHMQSWLRNWPWLLVLDGLDEVTDPIVRRKLIREVESFVGSADAENADLLVVVTTRPTGYFEEIDPDQFERLDLARLAPTQAIEYGRQVIRVRLARESERRERVVSRLDAAAANDTLRHLMQTPLQVLILTMVLEATAQLPSERYGLFAHYYDTVYRREVNKRNPLSTLLQRYRTHIDALHADVGFDLQCRSERAGGATASLTLEEFRQRVERILRAEGFDVAGESAPVVEQISQAATMRLVLLAPRPDGGVGFDLRSVQELMAARRVTRSQEKAMEALRIAAASPHWRNTWLFAAGRIFAEWDEKMRQQVVDLVARIDEDDPCRLAHVAPIGPELALELVDDGLARNFPRHLEALLRLGLKVLTGPTTLDSLGVARALVRAADTSTKLRIVIANGLRDALGPDAPRPAAAAVVCARLPGVVQELEADPSLNALAVVRPAAHGPVGRRGRQGVGDGAIEIIEGLAENPADREGLLSLVASLGSNDRRPDQALVRDILGRRETAEILELALEVEQSPKAAERVRHWLLPELERAAVGPALSSALGEG